MDETPPKIPHLAALLIADAVDGHELTPGEVEMLRAANVLADSDDSFEQVMFIHDPFILQWGVNAFFLAYIFINAHAFLFNHVGFSNRQVVIFLNRHHHHFRDLKLIIDSRVLSSCILHTCTYLFLEFPVCLNDETNACNIFITAFS